MSPQWGGSFCLGRLAQGRRPQQPGVLKRLRYKARLKFISINQNVLNPVHS
jgi:hypothetical protein